MREKIRDRVLIVGEVSAFPVMINAQRTLRRRNVPAILPEPYDPTVAVASIRRRALRARSLLAHVQRLRNRATRSILVVNPDREGEANYVSAAMFGEIAIAYAQRKPVFILYGLPKVFEQELLDWQAISLNGDLSPLISAFEEACRADTAQLELLQ